MVGLFSPDVITTPKGTPPAEQLVLKINVGQLYLSKLAVESQYVSSPACLINLCTLAISGVHTARTSGCEHYTESLDM